MFEGPTSDATSTLVPSCEPKVTAPFIMYLIYEVPPASEPGSERFSAKSTPGMII
jgi:hypothetical protein